MAAGNKPLAVVTGASSGIGQEARAGIRGAGYDLIICSASGKIESAARDFQESGTNVHIVLADLATLDVFCFAQPQAGACGTISA